MENKMTNTMQERFERKYNGEWCLTHCTTVEGELCEKEIKKFIQSEKELSKKEGQEEYKQFILNILDGVDIADGECNTKAIRLAINSRVI